MVCASCHYVSRKVNLVIHVHKERVRSQHVQSLNCSVQKDHIIVTSHICGKSV